MTGTTFLACSETRENNFDFLRFFLATLVLFAHCFALSGPAAGLEPLSRLLNQQTDGGGLAVQFFFTISGFLVTASWERSRSVWQYLQKRILRIYPGWIVSLVFCVLIVGPLGGADLDSYFTDPGTREFFKPLALHYTELPLQVFAHNPLTYNVNGSTWTIPNEIFCYLLLTLLGVLGLLLRRAFTALLFAGVLIFALSHPHFSLRVRYFGSLDALPWLFSAFLSGATFYLYRDKIPRSSRGLMAALAILALTSRAGLRFTLPICGTYALFWLAFAPAGVLRHFGKRGDFSYGIYLYAFPVQQLLIYYFGPRLSPWTLFPLAFLPTLALAWVSWNFVEKPFLRFKPSASVPLASVPHAGDLQTEAPRPD